MSEILAFLNCLSRGQRAYSDALACPFECQLSTGADPEYIATTRAAALVDEYRSSEGVKTLEQFRLAKSEAMKQGAPFLIQNLLDALNAYHAFVYDVTEAASMGRQRASWTERRTLLQAIHDLRLAMPPGPDLRDYITAKTAREQRAELTTHKKLCGVLKRNPEIRHTTRGQRMYVHAGDWGNYCEQQDRKAFDALDAPPEVIESVIEEFEQRKQNVRQRKAK